MDKLFRAILENSPRQLVKAGRRTAAKIRYAIQRYRAHMGHRLYGDRYPSSIIFIAGLPKSGTTWLESMLAEYPGYQRLTPADAVDHEIKYHESLSYQLRDDYFESFQDLLLILKMHLEGSPANARVLKSAGMKYVVLSRDLRDVAVSYSYYVASTPWHPDYPIYRQLSTQERLAKFAETRLLSFANWIRLWGENKDPELSLAISYEELSADPAGFLAMISRHFGLDSSAEVISRIVSKHVLKPVSDARVGNQPPLGSVVRKGRIGDWKEHFTPDISALYKARIGQNLIDTGYERDLDW